MLDLAIIVVLSHKIIESLDSTGKEDCDKAALAAHALFLVSAYYLVETDPVIVGKYLHMSTEFLSKTLDEEDMKEINNVIEKYRKKKEEADGRFSAK
jgi:hypothetical protein